MKRDSSDTEDDTTSSGGDEDDQTSVSWVACDRCSKWRRIPAALARALKDDTPWYCEHNPDKAVASCDVPQELTNEQIDAINEEAHGEDDLEDAHLLEERARRRRIPAVWQLIRDNILTHRKRKVQEEDDVMICNCKPHYRGGDGCGPDCINRMLCVECVPGFCPSEDRCTNQVFTKKQYAKLEVRRAGPKGFGLFALELIPAGQFIIEYIGEVLDEDEYLRRKDFYAEVGQRHYYFMNIGNGEVIDACRKGNRARFINHSCDPNCETQKWLARGELAIGLFALKDIAQGEELTFDYNFERYGDKPMRCYCGSRTCRKFIGGTQDTYDENMIVIDPEDVTNDFQPVMLTDADMDWASKALLDWRVGVYWDKEREGQVLGKLERVCKARGVPWTPAHFLGTAPLPLAADSSEALVEPDTAFGKTAAKPRTLGKRATAAAAKEVAGTGRKSGGSRAAKEVVKTEAPAPEAAEQQLEDDVVVKDEQGTKGRGKAGAKGRSRLVLLADVKEEKTEPASPKDGTAQPTSAKAPPVPRRKGAAAAASVRTDGSLASSGTGLAGSLLRRAGMTGSQSDRAETLGVTSSQFSAMTDLKTGEKESGLAVVKEEGGLKTERDTDKEAREAQSKGEDQMGGRAGSLQPPVRRHRGWAVAPRARRRSEIDRRIDQLVGASGRLKDASRQNIIKVLRMFNLCDIGPTGVGQRIVRAESPAPDPTALDVPLAGTTSGEAGTGRAGSQPPSAPLATGAAPANDTDALSTVTAPTPSQTTPQQPDLPTATDPSQPASAPAQPPSSEPATRLVLPPQPELVAPGFGFAAALAPARVPSPALPGMAPSRLGGAQQAAQPVVVTARQRARMADISLLLDVILKTSSATVRKDFVTCGVLNQLHQIIGRNFSQQYSVILRKVLRTIENLPITADDIYSVRTAHGTLADTLQELTSNQDYDVRTRATALLKKYPPSACQDQALVQRPPPQRRVPTGFSPALPPGAVPTPGADGAMQDGASLPPIPSRFNRLMRSALTRGFSSADMLGSVPASPAMGSDSPQVPLPDGEGQEPGAEPVLKRRRRNGFSDGPIANGDAVAGLADQRGTMRTPPLAAGLMPGPGRPLPYSYRHGSALLDYGPGSAPPPPPLDAEELFELLLVPEVVARRSDGWRDPVPSVRPVSVAEGAVHGERSDMETIFAVGVYDTDWQGAAQAAGQARARSKWSDAPSSPTHLAVPMSPLGYSVTSSPSRPEREAEELAAECRAAEQARLEQLAAQQRRQQQAAMLRADSGLAMGGAGMPLLMDIRTGSGRASGMQPGMSLHGAPRSDSPALLHAHNAGYPTDTPMHDAYPGPGQYPYGPGGTLQRPPSRHALPDSPMLMQQPSPAFGPGPGPGMARGKGPASQPPTAASNMQPPPNAHAPAAPQPQQPHGIDSDAEWARPLSSDYPESWQEPDTSFDLYVKECVRYRLGKYVTTPDHPNRITSEEANHLHRKIRREVVDKERQAYSTRRHQGVVKMIERRKVEHNIKEFVRLSIRRAHQQQAGGGAGAGH